MCGFVYVWMYFYTRYQIQMKFTEYVELATQTNRLEFDEDPISRKHIFRTMCNVSNINIISELISRTDRGRTNDLFTHNLMFSSSFKNRWWLSRLDVQLSCRRPWFKSWGFLFLIFIIFCFTNFIYVYSIINRGTDNFYEFFTLKKLYLVEVCALRGLF